MSFNTFRRKLGCQLANLAANLLPADSASKRLRNGIYRLMGVRIGAGTAFAGDSYINLGPVAKLTVGKDCFFNRQCYFDLSADILVEDGVYVGTHCAFVTADHEIGPSSRRAGKVLASPIRIGAGAWIGTRVTLLPGVVIGRGAVVASGALVRGSVPDNVLVAGVPAVLKRRLDDGEAERTSS
ncbi:acyltransferase [Bosea sp. ASV33]|uniref:acyltransferase n=1 Tax=Bosea sp. ASV33 TaxID=2795106 RepID=UPI0018EBFA1D|nr:acyltransferase [Bosea sp. ASV33]